MRLNYKDNIISCKIIQSGVYKIEIILNAFALDYDNIIIVTTDDKLINALFFTSHFEIMENAAKEIIKQAVKKQRNG